MNLLPKKLHGLESLDRRLAHPIIHFPLIVVEIHDRERRLINPRVL
jgi:hypothetical protein